MTIKTTGQFGEYAVASELCRRGWIATTFTRNMPGFDILALNQKTGKTIKIQVKTKESGEWSLDAKSFLEFDPSLFEEGIQKVINKKKMSSADFFIFVKMDGKNKDSFYIIPSDSLRDIVYQNYNIYLNEKNGRRPKNPKSTHTAITEENLKNYTKWEILENTQ